MRAGQDMCFMCGRVYPIDEMAPGTSSMPGRAAVSIWICPGCQLEMPRGRLKWVLVEGKRLRVKLDGAAGGIARVRELGSDSGCPPSGCVE